MQLTKQEKDLCRQIAEVYVKNFPLLRAQELITQIGFQSVRQSNSKLILEVLRPGLLIGKSGENVKVLEDALKLSIIIIESPTSYQEEMLSYIDELAADVDPPQKRTVKSMIFEHATLTSVLEELPDLLKNSSKWDSLIVNRRKPETYRVFSTLQNGLRVCLHRFDVCHLDESFIHPHPWPAAFLILEGSYLMKVGYSVDRISKPHSVISTVLTPGSNYIIDSPLTWHSVTPLQTTYTIMVNAEAWPLHIAHQDVRRTKGKDLDRMPIQNLLSHLNKFSTLIEKLNHGS